jgi:integrase/recombinase XerD
LEDYLATLAIDRGLSPHTVAAYRRDLTDYLLFVESEETDSGTVDAGTVDAGTVDAFARSLSDRDLKASSIARKLAAVKGFYRYLLDEGHLASDPTRQLPRTRRPDPFPQALTVGEVTALIEASDSRTTGGRRDRALLEFLYGTGARVSEAVGSRLHDLDLEGRVVLLTGKGDRQRQVPLGAAAIAAIQDWLPDRSRLTAGARLSSPGDRDSLFVNLRGRRLSRQSAFRIVRVHAERAGLDPISVSPHTLRHSAATHMVEAGADLRSVQVLLGHAKISTTQVYTRVSPQHLVEIFLESHPRSR